MQKPKTSFRPALSALCAAFAFCAASAFAAMPDGEFAKLCFPGTAAQVKQALKDGANPNARDERDPVSADPALHSAARSDTEAADKVRALLAAGADVEARERRYGKTALMTISNPEVAAVLLAAGAAVDGLDRTGQTALFYAAMNGNVPMIEALLRAGAAVNARSDSGGTALIEAASNGQPEAVRALLAAGADAKLKDGNGDALWHARHPGESTDREAAAACAKLLKNAVATAPQPEPWPGIEGEVTKTLPFRDQTGDNTLVLTMVETGAGDALGRKIFAYRYQQGAGGAAQQVWRVSDFVKDCAYNVEAAFYESRVEMTDLDKDGISEIWLPYRLSCHSELTPYQMKIIMYEGGQKHAMRGLSRIPCEGAGGYCFMDSLGRPVPGEGDGGTMDAALRSAPAAFREHAQKLWKKMDVDNWREP